MGLLTYECTTHFNNLPFGTNKVKTYFQHSGLVPEKG